MSIDLNPEDQKVAEELVASGRFASVPDVLHAGLQAIQEDPEWQEYARERIDAGLADVEADRGSSLEEVMARMNHLLQKRA